MDPKNQQSQTPFNPNTPISEVLKEEKEGFTPSTPPVVPSQKPSLSEATNAIQNYGEIDKSHRSRIIKTYSTDAAEAVRLQQGSVAKVAIAEEKEREKEPEKHLEVKETAPAKQHRFIVPVLVVFILLILGTGAIVSVQYFLNQKSVAVPITTARTIIPFDQKESLTLEVASHDMLVDAIRNLKPSGGIDYVEISEKVLDAEQKTVSVPLSSDIFASTIGPNMPGILIRSFDQDYMYGVDSVKSPGTFIIVKTSSYDQTFAGMLKWETKMIDDLTPILNLSPKISGEPFTDQIINNKNVRSVSTPDGTVYLLYGFLDNQTLVITSDVKIFQDINNRYIATRFVQ